MLQYLRQIRKEQILSAGGTGMHIKQETTCSSGGRDVSENKRGFGSQGKGGKRDSRVLNR